MKAFLATALIALNAGTLLAQGTVRFDNYIPGVLVTHVYDFNTANPYGPAQYGNGPNDTPAGSKNWSTWVPLSGSNFSAQIFALPGVITDPSVLLPASPIIHFNTGSLAGTFVPAIVTLAGVPADAPLATVQVRVWNNEGGAKPTWHDAMAGRTGASGPLFLQNIGGLVNPPPILNGLLSFSLDPIIAPEPSTWALGCLGAALAMLIRHRRRTLCQKHAP